MKAHKFVAVHGIEKAKAVLDELPNAHATHMTDDARMFVDENNPLLDSFQRSQIKDLISILELKQVVESVEIVESKGGLRKLKKEANCLFYNGFEGIAESYEKSIADYESIYGGEHV